MGSSVPPQARLLTLQVGAVLALLHSANALPVALQRSFGRETVSAWPYTPCTGPCIHGTRVVVGRWCGAVAEQLLIAMLTVRFPDQADCGSVTEIHATSNGTPNQAQRSQ